MKKTADRLLSLIIALLFILSLASSGIYAKGAKLSLIWLKDPVESLRETRDRLIEGVPQVYTAERFVRNIKEQYTVYTPPTKETEIPSISIGGTYLNESIKGKVTSVDPIAGTLILEKEDGSSSIITTGKGAYILKNGVKGTLRDIEKFDNVYARLSPELLWYIEVNSPEETNGKGSSIIDKAIEEGLLTADQLTALALGDVKGAEESLKRNVYNRLLTEGITPSEAEAIVTQDWKSMAELSKSRLTNAVSAELGVSKEMIRALMDQDWENAKAYAQIEAANYLISYLLKNSNL